MSYRNFCFTSYATELPVRLPEGFSYIVYQKEVCPTTGREHWQGYAEAKEQLRLGTIKRRLGDQGIHVEQRRGSAREAREYCLKSNTRIENGFRFEEGHIREDKRSENTSTIDLSVRRILQAGCREEAWRIAEECLGRRFMFHFSAIKLCIEWKFPIQPNQYIYKPEFAWKIPELINQWIRSEFTRKERCKCLIIIGPTRLGKTNWARSLGRHMFWRGQVSYGDWDDAAKYLVIDDIPWKFIPQKKSILTQMGDITLTDKYVKKISVKNNKPAIFLTNEEPDFEEETEYWIANTVMVRITEKMYDEKQKAI
nr:MAG: replication associated protein [Cressdnaviricota sp.]